MTEDEAGKKMSDAALLVANLHSNAACRRRDDRIAELEVKLKTGRDSWMAANRELTNVLLSVRMENAILRKAIEGAPHDPGNEAVARIAAAIRKGP